MNDRLPFDILSCIFDHYQQQEDVFHPLETLLLVCKSWSEAALSDRALWGRFNIRLGHEPVMGMWKKRLPLRLMRSGPTVPLDIIVHSEGYSDDLDEEVLRYSRFYSKNCFSKHGSTMWRCKCHRGHNETITSILGVLVGPNAEISKRWRRFRLDLEIMTYVTSPHSSRAADLSRALTSATPSLVSLSLGNISIHGCTDPNYPILPFAPLLREVAIRMCDLPRFPAMPALQRADIYYLDDEFSIPIHLEEAHRLQELTIHMDVQPITLPPLFSDLFHLTLNVPSIPSAFTQVSVPRLTCLTLFIWNWRLAIELSECSAFPLEQLTDLEIRHPRKAKTTYNSVCVGAMTRFLQRRIRLKSISSSESFFSLVIKWIWVEKRKSEAEKSRNNGQRRALHWEQGVLLTSPLGGTLGRLSGAESSVELESLAFEWGLSTPDISWETLFSILYHA